MTVLPMAHTHRVLYSASNALPGNCAITLLLLQRKIPLHVFGSVHRSGGSAWTSTHTFFLNAATYVTSPPRVLPVCVAHLGGRQL
jgi:hypothetical protein